MELSLRTTLPRTVEGDGAVVVPGKLLVDLSRAFAAGRGDDRLPTGGRRRDRLGGELYVAAEHLRGGGFPAPALRPTCRCTRSTTASLLDDDRPGGAFCVARRVAAGADRDPGAVRGQAPDDGCDGLVPALDQGDGAAEPGPELEAIIPARALAELGAHRRGRGDGRSSAPTRTPSSSARGTRWLTTRRIDGQFPDVKQVVAGARSSIEVEIPREELLRDRPPRGRDGATQRPAAAALCGGRVDGVGPEPGRRRDAASRCRSPYTGEPLEIGFNAEFLADGVDSVTGDTVRAEADQPAPARLDHGRRRRVLVPDHADPARRLIVREVTLRDFRSYARLELALEPGLVLVTGANGAGKTNLLEALHVVTQGFSPRTRSDAQLIRSGAEAPASH